MLLLLYNLILLPILVPTLLWRLLVRGKSREGLAERFGRVPELGPPPAGGRIWVHAVSMGETVAAQPVFAALRAALPTAEILVSTITPTGQAQARRSLPAAALHFYFPFDVPWVVRRVLRRLRPTVIVLMEAEVWPNLLGAAQRQKVPVVVANGHISDRTLRRALRLRPWLAPILAGITRYLAQSEAIRRRALALGLPEERVTVAGHTKFDQDVAAFAPEEADLIRAALGLEPEQPLFLAGSTHEGEEELVLDAWETARGRVPGLALMLAPRHLTRLEAIRELLRRRGLGVRARSDASSGVQAFGRSGAQESGPDGHLEHLNTVFLLDTMGELARFYGLASVAFVGGSLVPKGGHDILQPLFHGVPTLFGPHMHNQRALAQRVLEEGAGRQVADVAALAKAVTDLLTDDAERRSVVDAAARLLRENRGASDRCAREVAALLRPGDQGSTVGSTTGGEDLLVESRASNRP
jgi:3-deoxy-D-manno-octulosonic-acid transferase